MLFYQHYSCEILHASSVIPPTQNHKFRLGFRYFTPQKWEYLWGKHGQEKYRPFMGKSLNIIKPNGSFLWLFHWGNQSLALQSIRPPQSIVGGRTPRKLWGWKPESYPLLQDVLLPMTCLWVHGDLGFDQWDSEWLMSGRSSGFLQPNALAACWHLGTGVWSFFFDLGVTGKETPGHVPSGNLTVCYWKWPFIVSFPIKNGDFP